jgi:transcriptional regulator with XRE-family HTH domain
MLDKAEMAVIRTIGSRFRAARELCALRVQKAAKMLGIEAAQLSAIENSTDVESLPLALILKAAKTYDVSIDYLFGLSAIEWEVCPEAVLQREWGSGVRDFFIEELARLGVEVMAQQGRLEALTSTVLQLLPAVAEVCESLESFQKRNAGFDEMAGGNQLLYRVKKARQFGNIAKRRLVRVKILPMSELPNVE